MEQKHLFIVFVAAMVISSIIIGSASLMLNVTSKGTVPPSSAVVEIKNFTFSPENMSIAENTTVTWTNNDTAPHTVTTLAGAPVAFDSGTINPGGSFTYNFTVGGVYPYYCAIHPFMRGNVSVAGIAQTVSIDISNFIFHPDPVTIKVGTTVTWTNNDSMFHTVTTLSSAPAAFHSGNIPTGGTFTYTFTLPGTFPYYCKIHPWMMGNVTVTA